MLDSLWFSFIEPAMGMALPFVVQAAILAGGGLLIIKLAGDLPAKGKSLKCFHDA